MLITQRGIRRGELFAKLSTLRFESLDASVGVVLRLVELLLVLIAEVRELLQQTLGARSLALLCRLCLGTNCLEFALRSRFRRLERCCDHC